MTYKENITAILECYFTGFKKEIIDSACNRILEQEPSGDLISREETLTAFADYVGSGMSMNDYEALWDIVAKMPPVKQEPKTGHCKDCKYFEYDSVANVDGIPLIVAHEICNKWGDGCKTKEDGYCFLYEPRERSGEE